MQELDLDQLSTMLLDFRNYALPKGNSEHCSKAIRAINATLAEISFVKDKVTYHIGDYFHIEGYGVYILSIADFYEKKINLINLKTGNEFENNYTVTSFERISKHDLKRLINQDSSYRKLSMEEAFKIVLEIESVQIEGA